MAEPSTFSLRILFVCSGNTCRSPMAEVIARSASRQLGAEGMEFRSAGTSAIPGLPASDGARRTARRNGLDLDNHRSSALSGDLIQWADVILTMGTAHLIRTVELGGEGKTFLLGSFATEDVGEGEDPSIPDPYGGDDGVYEATFRTLERYVNDAVRRLSSGKVDS